MERLFLNVSPIALRCLDIPLSVKSMDNSALNSLSVMSGVCCILALISVSCFSVRVLLRPV